MYIWLKFCHFGIQWIQKLKDSEFTLQYSLTWPVITDNIFWILLICPSFLTMLIPRALIGYKNNLRRMNGYTFNILYLQLISFRKDVHYHSLILWFVVKLQHNNIKEESSRYNQETFLFSNHFKETYSVTVIWYMAVKLSWV